MKSNRHAKIIELITTTSIETQEELARKLQELGYKVTQATVSRDIKDLKLNKILDEMGKQKYVTTKPGDEDLVKKYTSVLKSGYVSMEQAGSILVVKTVSGMAMAVAAAIDAMNWKEVVGCIAGDDTIMCALKSAEDCGAVMEKLQKIISK